MPYTQEQGQNQWGGGNFTNANNPPANPNQYNSTTNPFFQTAPGMDPQDWYRTVQANISSGLLDPNSQFYQQYRKYLASVTPNIGTNSLLAPLMAGGGNQAASSLQANALRDEYKGERNDFLNSAVSGFASQNIAGGLNALSGAQSSYHQQQALNAQVESQEGDFGDFLLGLVPSVFSFFNPFGGGSAQGGGGQMTPGGYRGGGY